MLLLDHMANATSYALDFERPLLELEKKIQELRRRKGCSRRSSAI